MCFDGSLNFLIISEITTKTVGTRIAIPTKPKVNELVLSNNNENRKKEKENTGTA